VGKKVAMVLSGANVDREVFAEILGERQEARGERY
jgi:threonine dehydratase